MHAIVIHIRFLIYIKKKEKKNQIKSNFDEPIFFYSRRGRELNKKKGEECYSGSSGMKKRV
jgi:hypothetical protein